MDIKALIVDDDIISAEIIKSYIENIQGIDIVAICSDALNAYNVLRNKHIDLLFLDIEMPKISGIDFLKTLKLKNPPKVIITSSNASYAIEGYELDVLDYMLKPIHFDRFLKSINKYYNQQSTPILSNSENNTLENEDSYLYLKESRKIIKIYINEILYIESNKNQLKIVMENRSVIVRQTINYFEDILPENQFLRIHRAYLVAISKIEAFSFTDIEIGKKTLPIGRSYKQLVMNSLNFHDSL